MPSYLDLALLLIVVVSALLSMVRGFTREILAIASWAAAAISAYYFHPLVMPYLEHYIVKDTIRMVAAIAIVFFATLVIVSIVTVKLSDAILDSRVGALDRTLGFLFGAARGFLLGVVADTEGPAASPPPDTTTTPPGRRTEAAPAGAAPTATAQDDRQGLNALLGKVNGSSTTKPTTKKQ